MPPIFDYKVDDLNLQTSHHVLTAAQILLSAGLDPETHYLLQVKPRHISYEGKSDELIRIHENLIFASASLAPTTVS